MVRDLAVSISPSVVAQLIADAVTQPKTLPLVFASSGGRLLDDYRIETDSGAYICQVYTRYYTRVGSFVTLVVTVTDTAGTTSVHMATGGHKKLFEGSESDFGASTSFIGIVEKALADHVIPVADR